MSAAILLLAHGTPDALADMPAYLTRVRGGRPPSDALVAEMTRNYAAIGGRSPLTDITRAQGEALARETGRAVYIGMRNWHPLVSDAIAQAIADGSTRLLAIPLAPQYSTLSVAKYRDAVDRALPADFTVTFIDSWYDHPLLLDAFAEKVRAAQERGPWDAVVFTAHSLPIRVIESGDPYRDHVRATATGVARRAGLAAWSIAYQSAGRTDEPWLGPSLEDTIGVLAAEGRRRVLVCPVGFVCDHTEILFDIDIQAAEAARGRGLELARTESLNTSPTFIRALAALAATALG
jgi:protoporphyrin/coproporphyrin ferrochelatase